MLKAYEITWLNLRFDHHPPPTTDVGNAHGMVRSQLKHVASVLMQLLPNGDEKDRALENLELAMFWANAGIARHPSEAADRYRSLPKVPFVSDQTTNI